MSFKRYLNRLQVPDMIVVAIAVWLSANIVIGLISVPLV